MDDEHALVLACAGMCEMLSEKEKQCCSLGIVSHVPARGLCAERRCGSGDCQKQKSYDMTSLSRDYVSTLVTK